MPRYYYTYILECNDGCFYVGITNDLDRRLQEHMDGLNTCCYTYHKRPVTLIYQEIFSDVRDAIAREKQLKKWGREKKKALMLDDLEKLKALAKSKMKKG